MTATEPPAFNLATVHELQSALGYDTISMMQLIEDFYDDTTRILDEIREAHAAQKIDTLRASAHTLKSTTRTFGAEPLADLAEKLELAAREQNRAPMPALIDGIGREFSRLKVALTAAYTE